MSFVPGAQASNAQNTADIAALKQANVSAYAAVSAATTVAFGTFYDVTGSAAVVMTGIAAPASGSGEVVVKVDAAYTGSGVTFTAGTGRTVDGQASFNLGATPGTEYAFVISAGSSDYKAL